VKTRAWKGHEFGLKLSANEKKALIAFWHAQMDFNRFDFWHGRLQRRSREGSQQRRAAGKNASARQIIADKASLADG